MANGKNPNRSQESQSNHDKMVRYIANDLQSRGYYVRADHIPWNNGKPDEIDGYIPDVTASSQGQFLIFEIETCPTYDDEHTRKQLTAFSNHSTTFIIVPNSCQRNNQSFDPVPEVKQCLRNWGLTSVRVGTCNPFNGEIDYNK